VSTGTGRVRSESWRTSLNALQAWSGKPIPSRRLYWRLIAYESSRKDDTFDW